MGVSILGISAYYHDSAAALLVDGKIIAAAQEERFSRIKHDDRFPHAAVRFVLQQAGVKAEDVDSVVFYDKPFIKFERLVATYHAVAPAGISSFIKSIPVWLKDKLFLKRIIRKELDKTGKFRGEIRFSEHHLSHAASAFYPSPFNEAAILTVDGVGEWATTLIGCGNAQSIRVIKELHFPHSLGLLYSAFTYYLGFKVNSGEYKVMGLSPYGNPENDNFKLFRERIREELLDIREDGSFLLNMRYFGFASGLKMTVDRHWKNLFGIPRRLPEGELLQEHADMALAVQQVTEEIMLNLASTAAALTGSRNLTMAGGVALNCVSNEKIVNSGLFDQVWIQPAAGDAGGALGAALAEYHISMNAARRTDSAEDGMQGAYLGPCFSNAEIHDALKSLDLQFEYIPQESLLLEKAADRLAQGDITGWFQGRMEFGPRALGNRSILADPRVAGMEQRLNREIKFREGFRPFAPCVLEEEAASYFDIKPVSPYMLLTCPVRQSRRNKLPQDFTSLSFAERLSFPRSDIPAVTHLDYSSRLQTVSAKTNGLLHGLLSAFKRRTSCAVLINTSFNVRGEPMVCLPEEAIHCFLNTGMDCLVMGNYIVLKKQQKSVPVTAGKIIRFELD